MRVSDHILDTHTFSSSLQNLTERILKQRLESLGAVVHQPLRVDPGLRRNASNPQLSDVTFEDGRVIMARRRRCALCCTGDQHWTSIFHEVKRFDRTYYMWHHAELLPLREPREGMDSVRCNSRALKFDAVSNR
ncbi:hypothetical protein EV363DRAFT_621484 [Boletus edulis]|nr:hypothetical protein EV363DRAFT_621484 [Boletus edulis]